MVTENQIQDIKNIIVQTVKPKRVYLIGSYANDTASSSSDVDFLIIGSGAGLAKYERTGIIQKKLFHYPSFSIDLIMFSEEEIATKAKNHLSFVGQVLKTAKLLYES